MSTAPSNEVAIDALPLPQAKPPFLRRVRICGYKSIAFCDVTLEPLTILVGRNASGKSNFLDALAFLRDLLDDGLNSALENHGGMSLFSQELKTNRLMFEIESEFPSHPMLCRATYRVDLVLNARKQLEVEQEVLQLDDVTPRAFLWVYSRSGACFMARGLEVLRGGWIWASPFRGASGSGCWRVELPIAVCAVPA